MQKKIFINITNTRSLLAAVVKRALDDIQGIDTYESACAMAFILSETCKEYCLFLNIDYEALKEKTVKLKKNNLIFNKRGMMLKKIKIIKLKQNIIAI